MRSLLTTMLLLPFLAACQVPPKTVKAESKSADEAEVEMTMQQYWFGMIYRGPNYFDEVSAEDSQALQAAHLARIKELAASGEMALAGPFQDEREMEDPFIGLFLYDVKTREEAEALAASDPAVASGRLRVEIIPWYGVSGLTYPGDISP